MYRELEIIRINKFHEGKFFEYIKNKNKSSSLSETKYFYKNRPALVLRRFEPNGFSQLETLYLVVPLTTSNAINKWKNARTSLRIKFINENLKYGFSYLMLDSMMLVDKRQILGLYGSKEKEIELTGDQKHFLKRQIALKLGHLLSPFSMEEALITNKDENIEW